MFSKFVIQCSAMVSNNEVTEGLLIAVLGANFVLLFFIALHVATARLYCKQVCRLAIAITEKMDCDKMIDGLLSCSGKQLRNDKGTACDSLVSPDACSGETAGQQQLLRNDKVTGQKAVQDRVQNYRERLASVAAGGQARRYGLLAHRKASTASYIEELDDSEIRRHWGLQRSSFMRGWYLCFSRSRLKTNQGLLLTSRATRLSGTHLAVPPASFTIVMACS